MRRHIIYDPIVLARLNENQYEIMYYRKSKNDAYVAKSEIIATSKDQAKIELVLRNLKIESYLGATRKKPSNQISTYFFKLKKAIA